MRRRSSGSIGLLGQTILDVADALDAAMRMIGAAMRLRRLLTP